MNEPILKKAMTTLEFLSQDAEARRLYDDRQKFLFDEASMMEGARLEGLSLGIAEGKEKGIAEGRAEGKAEGKLEGESIGRQVAKQELVRNLLGKGMEIDFIIEVTGLTKEAIENLRKFN